MQHLVRVLAVLSTGAAGAFWLVMGWFVLWHGHVEDYDSPPGDFSGQMVATASIAGALTVLAGLCWYHAVRLRRAAR